MQTDENLAALFERAVTDLTPDISAMVRRAEQLGRKLRRRRRIHLATGSGLTVIAVVAAGFGALLTHPFAALGGHASPRAATVGMASAVGAHAAKGPAVYPRVRASASADQQQAVGAQSGAPNPMTPRQMLRVLRSMLPAGAVLTKDPTASNGPGSLEVNYNDGLGMADIMISIGPVDQTALTCPNPLWTDEGTRPAGALPISCAVRTPPGGGVERDAVMYADSYGFYGYDIYDQRPDNVVVFIQVANGYFDPYLPHVDRATPPGSMSLWESVVESPAWHG
jgi:hypothetical protein